MNNSAINVIYRIYSIWSQIEMQNNLILFLLGVKTTFALLANSNLLLA